VVWVGTPGHTGAPALDPTDERGVGTMVEPVRHRRTKGAATDMLEP